MGWGLGSFHPWRGRWVPPRVRVCEVKAASLLSPGLAPELAAEGEGVGAETSLLSAYYVPNILLSFSQPAIF